MNRNFRVLIATSLVFNFVTISALEHETNFGRMTVKSLIYKAQMLISRDIERNAESYPLSIDSTLSHETTSKLAVFLGPFASRGILSEAPKNISILNGHQSFLTNCSEFIPKDGKLFFSGRILLDKKVAGLMVFGDQATQSLDLVLFDESQMCKIKSTFSVRLSSGFISIKKLLINPKLPPIAAPVHTVPKDPENILSVDRYSNVYLVSTKRSSYAQYLGHVLSLSEDSVIRSGGVKSIALLDETLYTAIAYTDSTKGCAKLRLFKSKVDFQNMRLLSTNVFFEMPRCFRESTDLNLLAAGGRIHIFGKKMLFSIGNAEIWNGSESVQYLDDIGIVIEIDLISGEYRIISRGHRNPQGIATCRGRIFVSEQGPDGGDEINDVTKGGDFGWPRNSYGAAYRVDSEREESSFGIHTYGKRPLISWLPSIAAGDMICQLDSSNMGLTLWLATLKDMALHRIYIDERGLVAFDERIPVNERIRDFHRLKEDFYFSTDDGRFFSFIYRRVI